MVHPIVGRHLAERERIDAFQAGHVVAELAWIRASPVMGVDAADAAEPVLGHMGVELVQPQLLAAAHHLQAILCNGGGNGTAPSTHRTIAAARLDNAVRQVQPQLHRTAMAGSGVVLVYRNSGNRCDSHGVLQGDAHIV